MKKIYSIVKYVAFDLALLMEIILLLMMPSLIETCNFVGALIALLLMFVMIPFIASFTYEEVKTAFGITYLEKKLK